VPTVSETTDLTTSDDDFIDIDEVLREPDHPGSSGANLLAESELIDEVDLIDEHPELLELLYGPLEPSQYTQRGSQRVGCTQQSTQNPQNTQEASKRKRGRPHGSKDKQPRKKRAKLSDNQAKEPGSTT
jgi:hypothetical protein